MPLKRLRASRTALLTLTAFALIVAGLWTVTAYYLGPIPGAGIGLTLGGIAVLIIEGLSAGPGDR
jgi:hypothetical protein